ncbi:glycoside hydrolase/deacetylase, partial [Piromyces finnis]
VFTDCLKPGQVVLTFDDGPNPETTPIALEMLKKFKIKATFFMNGINYGNLETDPTSIELVKKVYLEGHDIGSHTYYHKDLFQALKDNTMKFNIEKMSMALYQILGKKPAFFRPPNGNGGYEEVDPIEKEMNDIIQKYLGSQGYNIIMWSADTNDWKFKDDIDAIIQHLNDELQTANASPQTHSFITLLHDVHPTTVNIVLPKVIMYFQNLGYTFVSLSECIGVSPY